MINEFSIKINTDSSGNKLSLVGMPIEAAESLKVFIESLTEVAKLHEDVSEVRLSLKEGSIEAVLEYPETSKIDTEIEDVIEGTSKNRQYSKLIKKIQDRIKLNGLGYSVSLKVNNQIKDLTEAFKSTPFVISKPRVERKEEVVFIKGHIYETGGKFHPNMHIETDVKDYTVKFKKEQAYKLPSLYGEIFLSAIKRDALNREETSYEFIDRYLTKELYDEYKDLYESIQGTHDLSRFRRVFDFIEENIKEEEGGLGRIVKLMRLYKFSQSDKGVLRSILMMVKPVKEVSQDMNDMHTELANNLRFRSKNHII